MSLNPDKSVHKYLLSSPASFTGMYEQEDFLIAPALQKNHVNRYFYVYAIRREETDNENTILVPNYSTSADNLCIALSVFYGKRFDNHGAIESAGKFWIPNYGDITFLNTNFLTNNQKVRVDLNNSLNFKNCESLINAITTPENNNLWGDFFTAGKFYLSSLKLVDIDLERAYLDLITCGELLSSFYEYSEDKLYSHDKDLCSVLDRMQLAEMDEKDICFIKKRLYQVKRRFCLTFNELINKNFFEKTESESDDTKLTYDRFNICIKSAYDLRSKYVHSGTKFKQWIEPYNELMYETLPYSANVDDKDFKKILCQIPTYTGLERIVRFSLLRFLHTNGINLHSDLDDDNIQPDS
jgi:hypothetical protein